MEEMSDNGNGSPKWVMRRNLTHKIVYRPRGRSELYDFTEDPRELRNLWEDHDYALVKAELLSGLMEWLVETGGNGKYLPMKGLGKGWPPRS